MSMARVPALHPMPERLKLLMSSLMENLLTIIEDKEGEGQNPLQLTIRISMSRGERLVLERRSSNTGNRAEWTSSIESS